MRQLLLIGSVLCAACTRDTQPTAILPDTTTVDGVLVMHHDATAFERAMQWTMDSVPTVVLDGDGVSNSNLLHARFLYRLDDGGSVLQLDDRIVIFDAAGHPARNLVGSGPDDRPTAGTMTILLPGDTLLSASLRRPTPDYPPQFQAAFPQEIRLAALRDGGVTVLPMADDAPPCTSMRGVLPTGELLVQTTCGSDDLAPVDGHSRMRIARTDRQLGEYTPLFEMPSAAVVYDSSEGRWQRPFYGAEGTVTIWGGGIVSTDGATWQIARRDLTGRIVSRIEVSRPRVPVSEAMRTRVRSMFPAEEPVFADSVPAIASLRVDHEGLLWATDFQDAGDSTWAATAFRADGAIVARVHGHGQPVWFSREHVGTRASDGGSTPRFGAWRLVPATAR